MSISSSVAFTGDSASRGGCLGLTAVGSGLPSLLLRHISLFVSNAFCLPYSLLLAQRLRLLLFDQSCLASLIIEPVFLNSSSKTAPWPCGWKRVRLAKSTFSISCRRMRFPRDPGWLESRAARTFWWNLESVLIRSLNLRF